MVLLRYLIDKQRRSCSGACGCCVFLGLLLLRKSFASFAPLRVNGDRSGAHNRDRTGDLILTKDVLCQLSYVGDSS